MPLLILNYNYNNKNITGTLLYPNTKLYNKIRGTLLEERNWILEILKEQLYLFQLKLILSILN